MRRDFQLLVGAVVLSALGDWLALTARQPDAVRDFAGIDRDDERLRRQRLVEQARPGHLL